MIASEFISVASVCAPECLENAGRGSFFEAVVIFAPEKLLLYLQGDLVQPFFRAISPIVVILEIGFKLLYSIFGGAELNGKLLSDLKGPLSIFLGYVGCPMQQVQCASRGGV